MIEFLPLGETTELPDSPCPHCGRRTAAASAAESNRNSLPSPGAISICDKCGGIGTFDESLKLRRMTEAEMADARKLRNWPEVERLSQMIRDAYATAAISVRGKGKPTQ